MNKVGKRFTNDQLLDVLSLSHNATAVYTTNDIIIETANDAMIAFWGKDRSVIGQPLEVAVPELQGQPFIAMLQEVLRTGIVNSGNAVAAELFIDGKLQTFYYDYEYRPIKNEKGETYCILHTANDVTELVHNREALGLARKKEEILEREQALNEELAAANEELSATNEELQDAKHNLETLNNELEKRVANRTRKLAENEARLRYMLEDAPVSIAVLTGRELIIEAANKKVLEAWGKTADIVGKSLMLAVPELLGQEFLDLLDAVFTSGEPYYGNEVKALLERNGIIEEVYSNFVYQPLKDNEGKTTSIMLAANVITEQVLARKNVEQAEEMLQFALKAGNIGTWVRDLKTGKLSITPILKEIYGFDVSKELNMEMVLERVSDEYRDELVSRRRQAIEEAGSYDMTFSFKRFHDDKLIWLRSLGKVAPDEQGNPTIFSGVVLDVTEQKQDEQRKNDFISMVSHELKTPLTSLNAYQQLLQAKSLKLEDPFISGALDKMNVQVKKMTTLINGFLNVSRLESGKILLHKEEFDLKTLVGSVVEEIQLTESSHRIIFLPGTSVIVKADQSKIAAVISNLLSNAIKYSPKADQVEISYEIVEDQVQLMVKDQGMGIKSQNLDKLFERFYRVETKYAHTISGFGIGLYLSAEIVKRHDGKIWVESEPGKGSVFYFTIPLFKD